MEFKLSADGHKRGKSRKALIGMPCTLLDLVDARAKAESRSRCELVRAMIIHYLENVPGASTKDAWLQKR